MAYRIFASAEPNFFTIQSYDGANAGGEDKYDTLPFVAEASGDEDITIRTRVGLNPINTQSLAQRPHLIRAIHYSAVTDAGDAPVGANQGDVLTYLNGFIGA